MIWLPNDPPKATTKFGEPARRAQHLGDPAAVAPTYCVNARLQSAVDNRSVVPY
jgi:hypothetical protein